jgi:hypothetical protein
MSSKYVLIVPVTGRDKSKLPHFLDNLYTDGGKAVGLTGRPSFTPQKEFWYSFLLASESTQGTE